MSSHQFRGYANITFDILIVFILPLAFAVRELILLRRPGRAGRRRAEPETAMPDRRPPCFDS